MKKMTQNEALKEAFELTIRAGICMAQASKFDSKETASLKELNIAKADLMASLKANKDLDKHFNEAMKAYSSCDKERKDVVTKINDARTTIRQH